MHAVITHDLKPKFRGGFKQWYKQNDDEVHQIRREAWPEASRTSSSLNALLFSCSWFNCINRLGWFDFVI